MKRDFFSDEGKKAYEVCLQHYIERGNTEKLAHQIVDHLNEEDIFRTYVSELARVCDLSRTTVYKYIDLLEGRAY